MHQPLTARWANSRRLRAPRALLIVLLLLLPLAPHAFADRVGVQLPLGYSAHHPRISSDYEQVEPPTGKYIHTVTGAVHYFDGHSVTPTGESGAIIQYAEIDVYRRDENSAITTPTTELRPSNPHLVSCASDFCVSAVVGVVGRVDVVIIITATPLDPDCKHIAVRRAHQGGPEPVTFFEMRDGIDYCRSGYATARLLVNETEVDADGSPY